MTPDTAVGHLELGDGDTVALKLFQPVVESSWGLAAQGAAEAKRGPHQTSEVSFWDGWGGPAGQKNYLEKGCLYPPLTFSVSVGAG